MYRAILTKWFEVGRGQTLFGFLGLWIRSQMQNCFVQNLLKCRTEKTNQVEIKTEKEPAPGGIVEPWTQLPTLSISIRLLGPSWVS